MKYKVIFNKINKDLEEEVQRHLDEGWQLHGGLVAASANGDIVAMQAVVFVCTNKQPGPKCPQCGGEPDNGFDRCVPPNPYLCTKCEQQPEPKKGTK